MQCMELAYGSKPNRPVECFNRQITGVPGLGDDRKIAAYNNQMRYWSFSSSAVVPAFLRTMDKDKDTLEELKLSNDI